MYLSVSNEVKKITNTDQKHSFDQIRDLLPTAFLKEKIIDKSQKLVPQTFLKEYVMMHSLRERVVENSRNKKNQFGC